MSYVANLDQVCIALNPTSSFMMRYPNVDHYTTVDNCQADALSSTTTISAPTCANTPYDAADVAATRYPAEPYAQTIYETSHVVDASAAVTTTSRRLRGKQ